MFGFTQAPDRFIEEFIKNLVRESPFNRLEYLDGGPVSDEPLVGFADAYDPLMDQFKDAVSPSHLSPPEAWQQAFPGAPRPGKLSIIAWVLPLAAAIRTSNRGPRLPSRHWAHGRLYTEAISNEVRDKLVGSLSQRGHRAVAPARAESFDVDWDGPNGPVSNWSERHYCYAAGLGSFGLNRALITASGTAMRCGSVVADIALPPSDRKGSLTANCPFLETGACGDCIARCPAGAITPEGKDNIRCYRYLFEEIGPHIGDLAPDSAFQTTQSATAGRFGICGLCHSGVPCEGGIPPPSLFEQRVG